MLIGLTGRRVRLIAAAGWLLAVPSALAAQPAAAVQGAPGKPAGLAVWVTTADGAEQKGTLLSFSAAELVLQTRAGRTAIPFGDVRRVETPDSLRNGMRNGAIAGSVLLALPAIAAVRSEPCRNGCPGEATAFVLVETGVGACIGAMIGAGIDRLVVSRRAIYSASGVTPRVRSVSVAPILSPRTMGVGASIRW